MAVVKLNFESLAELDRGRLGKVLEKHIETVTTDCLNRPCDAQGKSAPREINITLKFSPKAEFGEFGDVNLKGISVEAIIASKLPKHLSSPVQLKVTRGGLLFNPEDNEDHPSLFEDQETK